MSKHTPGPWNIQLPTEEIFCTEIINGDWSADGKSWIASVHNQFVGIEDGSANARLIAAAPEMYEILKGWAQDLKGINRFEVLQLLTRINPTT